jgi:hypothetical protein
MQVLLYRCSLGDRNGYNLTFDGIEQSPFPMVADYTTNPFDNGAFTNVSIQLLNLISSFHIYS